MSDDRDLASVTINGVEAPVNGTLTIEGKYTIVATDASGNKKEITFNVFDTNILVETSIFTDGPKRIGLNLLFSKDFYVEKGTQIIAKYQYQVDGSDTWETIITKDPGYYKGMYNDSNGNKILSSLGGLLFSKGTIKSGSKISTITTQDKQVENLTNAVNLYGRDNIKVRVVVEFYNTNSVLLNSYITNEMSARSFYN